MSFLPLKLKQAPLIWLEPHNIYAGGQGKTLGTAADVETLGQALAVLPEGPTHWVVDDLLAPAFLMRDVVELPPNAEGRDSFFRWRFSQDLGLEAPHSVQSLDLGGGTWLLAGVDEELRESWLQMALRLKRPIHSMTPRWLWIYNRLAPTRSVPGILLSLCHDKNGLFTGTLAAWGRTLILLRQWAEPASPEAWMQERVTPTVAYLQRDARSPQELWVWGTNQWPDCALEHHIIPMEIPAQEAY